MEMMSAQMRGCLGTKVPLMQKLIITLVCQRCQETFDKLKDPVSNSESFLKGEKTTGEETVLTSTHYFYRKAISQIGLEDP